MINNPESETPAGANQHWENRKEAPSCSSATAPHQAALWAWTLTCSLVKETQRWTAFWSYWWSFCPLSTATGHNKTHEPHLFIYWSRSGRAKGAGSYSQEHTSFKTLHLNARARFCDSRPPLTWIISLSVKVCTMCSGIITWIRQLLDSGVVLQTQISFTS